MNVANNIRIRILLGSVFATNGLVVFGIGAAQLVEAIRASSWPSTGGKITESEVIRLQGARTTYQARVAYRYEVDGHPCSAERVRIAEFSSSPDGAHRVVARYPVGARVDVHYTLDA